MRMTDIMREELMLLPATATTKEEILDEMANKLVESGAVNDFNIFRQAITEREESASTGIGDGIAMPHAKNTAVQETSVVFAKQPAGIDYDSLDGQPARLFFMIAAKNDANETHLQILANLSKLLMNEDFKKALEAADTPETVTAVLNLGEASLERESEQADIPQEMDADKPYIIAVTACPTGIAHTYMAEDALKNKAKELGVNIKVETDGSEGVKNRLTAEDIEKADGIVVAVGKKVPMGRFAGKRVVERPVADGINKSEELINLAISGEAPVYQASKNEDEGSPSQDNGEDRQGFSVQSLYNDIMSGVSTMLPFVIAGGIIMAFSFLLEGFLGSESAMFTGFNSIGNAAFSFLIPVLAGYIAMSIGGRPAMVSGFSAGALAVSADAGFLGGLVGGFLAGYITLFVIKSLKGMPKNLAGLRTILLYPILTLLLTGLLMYFILAPIFATINIAMITFLENLGTGNQVLLGTVLGGMMAVDMGGPVNKAAYAFSIGLFTDTGDGRYMAAVMIGGMIPPLAIALASVLFKNKFTEVQRQSGLSNFILGLSFITEGAIPFAAADPLRVIVSSIIGSAVGGGLSQLWLTSVPAPHGGIFTMLALGENRIMLMLAVLIGTAISAVILGLWKKPVEEQMIAREEQNIIAEQ